MEIKQLCDGLFVSPQITAGQMAALKEAGVRAIICNRPDGEDDDQPAFSQIADAARALGLRAVHQPIVPGQICAEDGAVFARTLAELPSPVLAYCRSGARAQALWEMTQPEADAG